MNSNYNVNYSRRQVDNIIEEIHKSVNNNKYIISLNSNRKENIGFIDEYNIRKNKQDEILLGICTDDFCGSVKNIKKRFENETLFIFVPIVNLYDASGEICKVEIYTKFNIINQGNDDQTIVISFHKKNKPIDYLFK